MWKELRWPDGLRLWSQQATKKNIKLRQEFLGVYLSTDPGAGTWLGPVKTTVKKALWWRFLQR